MGEDISRKAIIVLLVLVVLITILSTWITLESVNILGNNTSFQKKQEGVVRLVVEGEPTGTGEVDFKVTGEEEVK